MLYILLVVLQSTIFALVDVFAKLAYKTVSYTCFQTLRFLIAVSLSFAVYGKKIIKDFRNVSLKHYIVPSLCMGIAVNLCSIALNYTTATTYSFIRNMNALITPLFLTVFFGRKYKSYDFILQITLVAGLYLLCAKGGLSDFGLGEILAIIVAILLSCSIVFGSDAVKYVSSETLSTSQFIAGMIFGFPLGFMTRQYITTDWSVFLNSKIILLLLFNAVMGAFVGYLLQNIAIKHLSAKVVGIVQCTYPVATATFAALILNERLTTAGLIGAGLITAVVFAQALLRD